jgi:hypothetical protein
MSSSKVFQHTGFVLAYRLGFIFIAADVGCCYSLSTLPMLLPITDGDAPQGRLALAT